jgi:hypothetical protein
MTTRPIACTLSPAELRAQRDELLPGLISTALQRIPLPHGVRLVFGATAKRLRQLHAVEQLEKRCCAFLQFRIDLTPGGGALVSRCSSCARRLDPLCRAVARRARARHIHA